MDQEKVNTQETAEAQQTEQQAEQAAPELSPEEKLQQSLDEAEARITDLQDKYLRLSAEFDNYRKRTIKEKSEIIKTAAEKTITAILPVLDDMERALLNMQKSDDAQALREGMELINAKFLKILSQEGLNKIETEGADFNTDFHEAIAMIPAPSEDQKGKVLDCVQTGYKLNDKVIRHAKVAVAQ
ncbi:MULTISPECIES: nucleotide exchange factor GrpE [Mediterranea]|uniref:nucleotide exchange factor GrpE n=1 Tax=Mediterranea TaxID=1926659 RepID=UPI0020117725|nr:MULTISPECIES: nucleotide exchange factor GrpE [Mediterranea]MCL1607473.1 nucleotide exchange factor GrpE [Mediterranea sp. ET5]MDM8122360.1 nucleotide exchange factor GrpE [Mediterranea massiliensis]MDM8198799.1 nucleotide exchange factor GrpE [Mediterranea massiliensis]